MNLTISDLTILLQKKEKDIRELVKRKKIPFHEINDRLIFNKQQIVQWALDNNVPLNISGHEKMAEYQVESINAMLDENSFFYNCKFSELDYIESIVGLLPLEYSIDKDIIIQLLRSREALMSTSIGYGISLPHPRIPLIIGTDKPVVNFFFPKTPLNVIALDKQPVHTIVLIISQTVKQHLSILAHLGFLLSKPELRDALASRNAPKAILSTMENIEELSRNQR